MSHKLGLHWQRTHPDNKRDFEHIERMQYRSVKLFGPEWSNADFCRDLLAVLPRESYILARDHPLSEQKQDMWDDPEGTGKRHADEWANKLHRGIARLPTDRTFFLGINEPDATDGDRSAIDRYTVAFLTRLQHHGLRGGAFNFSTGHPRTVDGTDNTPADYSVFEGSHAAIVRGHHIGVAHIYGTAAVPLVPGNYDRLQACPWEDVEWVIGECGIDEHVIGGGDHIGYLGAMDEPSQYPAWMDTFIAGVDLRNIHSYEFFTFDHAHPWATFDVRAHMDAVEQYDWQHGRTQPAAIDHSTHLPNVQSGNSQPTAAPDHPQPAAVTVPELVHPVADPSARRVTQRFGDNPQEYERFGLQGHAGVDFAVPEGTVVVAVDRGVVIQSGAMDDYGEVIKIRHAWGESVYAHLQQRNMRAGNTVSQRQIIGLSGNSGNSTGPHLHFAVRISPYDRADGWDGFSDPLPYLHDRYADLPAPNIQQLIKRAASEFGVEWPLYASLIWAESSNKPDAESHRGAQGLAQIMPDTWAEWAPRVGAGDDPFDARDNLRIGAAYMRWLLDRLGNEWSAVSAYNFGIQNVLDGNEPPEDTVIYIRSVLHGADLLREWVST